MSVWGVLLTGSQSALELQSSIAPLRACCDEVVVVYHGSSNGYDGPDGYAGTRLGHLLAGLRLVPADVSLIAFVDDVDIDTGNLDAVGRMIDEIEDDMSALTHGAVVTDALKKVDGDRIVGGVDRTDLLIPESPQILRREHLTRALGQVEDSTDSDPAALLSRCGMRVGVVAADGGGARPAAPGAGEESDGASDRSPGN